MNARRLLLGMALAAALVFAFAGAASAHVTKTSTDGKIKFTFGWESEPATTEIPNRILVRIVDNATGAGIAGVEAIEGLAFSLHLGEEEKELELEPQPGAGAGNYTSTDVITPSEPGIYELHAEGGSIQGSDIEVEIPANHELTDIADTYWPTKRADVDALQKEIELLQAKVATLEAKAKTAAETTTPVTGVSPPEGGNGVPALGLVAVLGVLALVALRRRT